MKAYCQRKALHASCVIAQYALPAKSIKPVLDNFKIVAEGNRLAIMATDLAVEIRTEVEGVMVQEAGTCLVPAERLTGIVKECGEENVVLTADDSDIVIATDTASFTFQKQEDDFPDVDPFPVDGVITVDHESLEYALERVIFATGKEGISRSWATTGVKWFIDTEEKQVTLVATDSCRMAVTRFPFTGDLADDAMKTGLVAGELLKHVLRFKTKEDVHVCLMENSVSFQVGRTTLHGRLLTGRFPDYRAVLPKNVNHSVIIGVGDFKRAARLTNIMADFENTAVTVDFSGAGATFTTKGRGKSSRIDVPANYIGADGSIKVTFLPWQVIDMLKFFKDDEALTINFEEATRPFLFQTTNFQYVVVPQVK